MTSNTCTDGALRAEIGSFQNDVRSPLDVIQWAVERFRGRLVLACSFQKESSVLIDMFTSADPSARIVISDTHLLFPETYETWRAIEQRYGIQVERLQGPSLAHQAEHHGERLWERDPDMCCEIRKVGPLSDALATADAWMSGLRRDQSPTRADAQQVAWDAKHGLVKINPLVSWNDADVWRYITERELPYNSLHDHGFASIGCMPCTRPGSGRAGRWARFDKVECGMHI